MLLVLIVVVDCACTKVRYSGLFARNVLAFRAQLLALALWVEVAGAAGEDPALRQAQVAVAVSAACPSEDEDHKPSHAVSRYLPESRHIAGPEA